MTGQSDIDKMAVDGNGGDGKGAAPVEFKNIRAVAAWLKKDGWAIGQTQLYTHNKEGKLRPDLPEGGFSLHAVQKYAATHLTKAKTRLKLKDEDLQRRKVLSEIERNEEDTKRARVKRLAEEGRYVLMEEMWRILASRVVTMDTMRRASIMTHASEVVALVGGDSGRIPDLIAFELKQHEEEMNVFSSTDEFSALLPANVEPDERDDDESFS